MPDPLFFVHRHMYVCTCNADVRVPSSIAYFRQRSNASERMADESVAAEVDRKRLKTVPFRIRELPWSTIAGRRREVGFTRTPTTAVKESEMIRPRHLGCLVWLTTVVLLMASPVGAAEPDIAGKYNCVGTNVGGQPYRGNLAFREIGQ